MNAYEAILAAADHIERFPLSYNFNQGNVVRNDDLTPEHKRTFGPGGYPACMLAKIGEFAGAHSGMDHSQVARHVLGLACASEFYHRIKVNSPAYALDPMVDRAVQDPKTIPSAMREVAKDFIPKEVRDIFKVTDTVGA